jgi:hypothetical protein
MLCGFFRLTRLPVASTFWHYVDSLGINQANSVLNMMRILRERLWQVCAINYRKIHLDALVKLLMLAQQCYSCLYLIHELSFIEAGFIFSKNQANYIIKINNLSASFDQRERCERIK